MFYLDNFKTPQPTISREHHLDMWAGLSYSPTHHHYTAASQIKLIPDISQSKILLGHSAISGWGIENDHTIEKYLSPTTTNIIHNGRSFQSKKSKTFLSLWNPTLPSHSHSDSPTKHLVDVYIIIDPAWPYIDANTGV